MTHPDFFNHLASRISKAGSERSVNQRRWCQTCQTSKAISGIPARVVKILDGLVLSATSNVVDVYVRYLRNKLNAGGHANLIQARRGFGYVLEASAT